jgi:thiol-disulfide isomerase/thioredoxin
MVKWFLVLGLLFAGCAGVQPVGPQVALHSVSEFPTELGVPTSLLVFATVWCEPCKKEWPEVVKWAAGGQRRVLYVVSGSSADRVQELMAGRSVAGNIKVFLDSDGVVAREYGVQATPTLYLYKGSNRDGPLHRLGSFHGD